MNKPIVPCFHLYAYLIREKYILKRVNFGTIKRRYIAPQSKEMIVSGVCGCI